VGALKEQIGMVGRLQNLDRQIARLRAEAEEKPRLVAEERRAVDEARARLAEAEHRVKEAHRAADRKELDVRTKEEAIQKLEGQLNTATSNKVYSELLLNIKSARMDVEKLEESILAMMDDAESLEADLERVRVEVREAEDAFRGAEKGLLAQAQEVEGRLAKKRGIRDLLAKEVDPEVLAVYERVREARKGVGIAGVDVDAEGSHFCTACQMTVTLQDISLAMAGNRLVQCRSCNRILAVEALPVPEGDEADDA
jgi:predicted  nucleic acid-binding Zn-ribbon protein